MSTSPQPKERPILFSGPMVRAILGGRKTQTRRIVKPQPFMVLSAEQWHSRAMSGVDPYGFRPIGSQVLEEMPAACPYGIPGDRLWVREKWRLGAEFCSTRLRDWRYPEDLAEHVHYAIDDIQEHFAGQYRPSIFMPRWASRITLEITGIRVERLQDITEEDAIAEGFERDFKPDGSSYGAELTTACEQFESLWQSINGPESWAANPWVWLVEFRRVEH
jgi:hypothetical protein